jgi:hypothetical protein
MPEEKILETEVSEKIEMPSEKQDGVAVAPQETPAMPEKEASAEKKSERVEGKYNEILSKVLPSGAASTHSDENVASDAQSISAITDEESKIQKLLDLAGSKGVVYAVKVARKLDDYYALDMMRDALADKLYDGLLARGLIQKD